MNKEEIKQFQKFLDCNLYMELLMSDMVMNNITWEGFLSFGPDIFKSVNRHNELFKLLLFGESISYSDFTRKYFCNNWLNYFIDKEIMIKENDLLYTNNLILIVIEKKFLFFNTPLNFKTCRNRNTNVYLGIDSLLLIKNQSYNRIGKVLDLCTGSGVQLLTSSEFYSNGIGVDIDDDALNIAEVNIILNNLEDKISLVKSNIYENITSSFDLIYANPPFLPMNKSLKFSKIGDGGENGFKLLDKIVTGFSSHLNLNGKAIIIGECLGSANTPMIVDYIKSKLPTGFVSEININSCIPAKIVAKRLAYVKCFQINALSKLDEYYQNLYDLYNQFGEYYFQYILKIKKVKSDINSTVKNTFNCSCILLNDKYSFINEYFLDKDNFTISICNNRVIQLNKNIVKILSLLDGEKTLNECFSEVCLVSNWENVYLQLIPIFQELLNNEILCRNVTFSH